MTYHVMSCDAPHTAHVRGRHWLHHRPSEDLPVLLSGAQGKGSAVLLRRDCSGPGGLASGGHGTRDVWSIPAVWVSRCGGKESDVCQNYLTGGPLMGQCR